MRNFIKKAVVLILALSILVLQVVAVSAQTTTKISFKDVKSTAWYYSYVLRLVDLKITSGYSDGTYKPYKSVSRAEFVTFLCNIKGYKQMQGNPFIDSQKSWASGYITAALANGIIDLPADQKFRPNYSITRNEVAEMICRALNLSPDEKTETPYADVTINSGYSTSAYSNFLMQGSLKDNKLNFKPNDNITRGEVAAVLVNAYDYNTDKMAYLNKKISEEMKKKEEAEKSQQPTNTQSANFKQSVDFLKQRGIIPGDSDRTFTANANVTKEQYIKMLLRALDVNPSQSEDYINSAINQGILQEGEFKSYSDKIKRAEMAKLTLRAYEKINNVQYPDYLEAYKTMVTDYKSLNKDDKTNSLKGVSEGLLTPVNGAFKPNDYCTGELTATVLHRLLSAEQRESAKPIFAKPDKVFEKFMSEENYSNAAQVCSRGYIDRVVDGKILWKTYEDGVCLLPTLSDKHSNKEAYEAVKALVGYAQKYKHYVEAYYCYGGVDNLFQIFYISSQYAAHLGNTRTGYNFSVMTRFNEDKTRIFNDVGDEKLQKKKTDYRWDIVYLNDAYSGVTPKTVNDYQSEELIQPLTACLNIIYEPNLADYLLKYILKENSTRNEYNWESKRYVHKGSFYPNQFKGLEVQVKQRGGLLLGTNKIN